MQFLSFLLRFPLFLYNLTILFPTSFLHMQFLEYSPHPNTQLSTHTFSVFSQDRPPETDFWCPKGTCLNYTSGGQSLYILLVGTVKSLFYAC